MAISDNDWYMKLLFLFFLLILAFLSLRTKVANQKICPLVQNKSFCQILGCTYFDPDVTIYIRNPCQPKK